MAIAYLDDYDDFVDLKSNYLICQYLKQYKNYTLIGSESDNLFDYTDPENIPNYPGRVIYSKLNIQTIITTNS